MKSDSYEEALTASNKAIDKDPSYYKAWIMKGDLLR